MLLRIARNATTSKIQGELRRFEGNFASRYWRPVTKDLPSKRQSFACIFQVALPYQTFLNLKKWKSQSNLIEFQFERIPTKDGNSFLQLLPIQIFDLR